MPAIAHVIYNGGGIFTVGGKPAGDVLREHAAARAAEARQTAADISNAAYIEALRKSPAYAASEAVRNQTFAPPPPPPPPPPVVASTTGTGSNPYYGTATASPAPSAAQPINISVSTPSVAARAVPDAAPPRSLTPYFIGGAILLGLAAYLWKRRKKR
jgi:LPXTG-motif cell wall-anchored protein